MVLQHLYRPVLNFIYGKFTYRINEKTRNIIIFICLLSIFAVQFAAQYIFKYEGLNRGIRDYFICLMMGIMIIVSVNRKLEIIRWNMWAYIPFTITGLMIFVASLDHEMGPSYQAFPLTMLVEFMCLFYVWGCRRDYTTLFKIASLAYLIYIFVIFIGCVIYYPYYDNSISEITFEYAPFGINPNGVTKLFAPGVVSGLFLMILYKRSKLIYLYAFVAGLCSAVIILTKSRAGIIILLLIVIIYIMYLIIERNSEEVKNICYGKKRMFTVLTVTLILCISCVFGIFLIKDISPEISSRVSTSETVTAGNNEEVNSEEDLDAENEAIVRQNKINESLASVSSEVYEDETLSRLNQFMAGRVQIWMVYFKNMTWQGSDELMFYDTEYAHNQYIELSYKAGIMTGIVYLIFNVIAGVMIIKNIFNNGKRRHKYVWFQGLSFVVFFIISMLDTGVMPFERGFIFLYYISIAPLFINEDIIRKKDILK